MPNRQLTQQDNFETISTWLDVNLADPFPANLQHLPPNDNSRGIYFWFMKADGYQRLSNFALNITAITPTYKKEINGKQYDLVYLGTAGTGKKEKSNIINRLNWHLKNTHDEKHICSGFLSTLRQTVGAALSDDLINTDTGLLVNTFFSDLFYLYTLPYSGNSNTKSIIDDDEHTLISTIKPLLNIKNNPNARINAGQHPTRQLKVRRGIVMHTTRERIGCKKGNNGKAKSKKDDNKPPSSPINNYELIYDKDGCQEFTVTKEQSVHDVVSGIKGLPTGKCEIVIYNSADPNMFIYTSKHNNGKRVTGDKKITIYGYFNNIDTNKNNLPRWKLIQQEMLDKGIEEITVRVCSDAPNEAMAVETSKEKSGKGRPKKNEMKNTTPKLKNVKASKTLNELKAELQKLKLSENFNVVLTCAGTKHGDTEMEYNGNKIEFRWRPNQNNQYKPFDKISGKNISWKQFLKEINKENANNVIEEIAYNNIVSAYELYNPQFENRNIYVDLHNCFLDRFFIASAGWGIVKSDFRLPNYDITYTKPKKEQDANKYRNPNETDFLHDINEFENLQEDDDILFFGSKNYLKQFISLTQNLPNRKVVIYNSQNIVLPEPNPYGGVFIPLYFPYHDNRKGHYAAAQMLIDIYCPNNHE
jgi:hypothetical protein